MTSLRLTNPEAEMIVAAAVVNLEIDIDEVLEHCSLADFTVDLIVEVLSAAEAIQRLKRKPDLMAVLDHLRAEISAPEWQNFVNGVTTSRFATHTLTHAKTIATCAKLRQLTAAVAECNRIVTKDGGQPAEMAEECANTILSAVDAEADDDGKDIMLAGRQWLASLEEIHRAGKHITGLETGFADLDKACRGLHAGELIILGARPAMGKSVLALNIANHASKAGKAVYFVSLEMGSNELMDRMAACDSGASYEAIQSADFEVMGHQVTSYAASLSGRKMVIDDSGSMSVAKLRARLLRFRRKHGQLDLVIVDYLQLMNSKGKDRYEQVSEISRGLKVLAMELGIPIICLSQLNRELDKRQDKRPMLSDLRDSGSLEQDANIVLFLYREDAYVKGLPNPWVAELIIAKLRHGRMGTIPLIEQFNRCRFLSADQQSLPENWRAMTAKPEKQLTQKSFVAEWRPGRGERS